MSWIRSSRCEANNCVEVASGPDGVVVRDSADRRVVVSREAWRAFLAAVPRRDGAGNPGRSV